MSSSSNIVIAMSVFDKTECVLLNLSNMLCGGWSSLPEKISIAGGHQKTLDVIREWAILENVDDKIITTLTSTGCLPITEKSHRRLKIVDCITTSINSHESFDNPWCLHVHSDAFPVKDKPVRDLIASQNSNVKCLFRGRGTDFRSDKCRDGDVDDHFFLCKLDDAKRILKPYVIDTTDSFQASVLLEYLKNQNPESFLSMIFSRSFSREEMHLYDDLSKNKITWKNVHTEDIPDKNGFYLDGVQHRSMHPVNIDWDRSFAHIGDLSLLQDVLLEMGVSQNTLTSVGEFLEKRNSNNND